MLFVTGWTWTFNFWGTFSLLIWTAIMLRKRSFCPPHTLMAVGTVMTVLALLQGDGMTMTEAGSQALTGLIWWWLGGGCNRDPRWRKWKAALGNLAGELRQRAMAATMRDRLIPQLSPA